MGPNFGKNKNIRCFDEYKNINSVKPAKSERNRAFFSGTTQKGIDKGVRLGLVLEGLYLPSSQRCTRLFYSFVAQSQRQANACRFGSATGLSVLFGKMGKFQPVTWAHNAPHGLYLDSEITQPTTQPVGGHVSCPTATRPGLWSSLAVYALPSVCVGDVLCQAMSHQTVIQP